MRLHGAFRSNPSGAFCCALALRVERFPREPSPLKPAASRGCILRGSVHPSNSMHESACRNPSSPFSSSNMQRFFVDLLCRSPFVEREQGETNRCTRRSTIGECPMRREHGSLIRWLHQTPHPALIASPKLFTICGEKLWRLSPQMVNNFAWPVMNPVNKLAFGAEGSTVTPGEEDELPRPYGRTSRERRSLPARRLGPRRILKMSMFNVSTIRTSPGPSQRAR